MVDTLRLHAPAFSRFVLGATVADVVNPFEGGDDVLVVGDDEHGGLELRGHQLAQNFIVIFVRSNPKPHITIMSFHRQCPILQCYANRP